VKLLDLGLARLCRSVEPDTAVQTGEGLTSILTPKGMMVMMGTPDYLAPEQALDFHGADIRADIYGLGCTFFYLLAGQPPFAGGAVPQKLLKHQREQPPPISQFRADVSPAVAAVLVKMMAKDPRERYQTPAEVDKALSPFSRGGVRSATGQAARVSRL